MQPPSSLYLECPECGKETLHQVLKAKVGEKGNITLDGTFQCTECEKVHKALLQVEKPVEVPVILSWQGESKKTRIELGADEPVSVDEELVVDDVPCMVTAVEVDGRRVDTAQAKNVDTIWTKRFDKVKISFSINKGRQTIAKSEMVPPHEEFYVGDLVDFGRDKAVIHAIKAGGRMLHRGGAEARDIVRVYCKQVRR